MIHNYYFDTAQRSVDWQETWGGRFLFPLYTLEGYTRVTVERTQTPVAKTTSVALRILCHIANSLGAAKLGRTLLASSTSYMAAKQLFDQLHTTPQRTSAQSPPPTTAKTTPPADTDTTPPATCSAFRENPPSPAQRFDKLQDQYSFADSMLQALQAFHKAIDVKGQYINKQALFLHSELLHMHHAVQALKNAIHGTPYQDLQRKVGDADEVNITDIELVQNLATSIKTLEQNYDTFLLQVKRQLVQVPDPQETHGIANAGNSCYITASLQPLLAISYFRDLVPDCIQQDDPNRAQKSKILTSLKTLVHAWEQKQSVFMLGTLCGELRTQLFQFGLNINQGEMAYQDSGSFLETLLHLIGQTFQSQTTLTYTNKQKSPPHFEKTKSLEAILRLKDKIGTIQTKIQTYSQVHLENFKPENALVRSGVTYTTRKEINKILGMPGEVLVVYVNPYQVNPTADLSIDCSQLFENVVEAQYELLGFCQNHGLRHWTSVVRSGRTWKYCDDARVENIETTDPRFQHKTTYLVYKRTVMTSARAE